MLLTLAVLLGVGPAAAAAADDPSSVAPPGNSAVDQYRESLPPSSGERRSLSEKDRRALRRQGPDGRALEAVLERSGGVPRASGGEDAGSGDSRPGASARRGGAVDSAADGAPRSQEDDPATSGAAGDPDSQPVAPAAAASTVGPVPVWSMLVAAVVLVGVGLVVRRRATP